VAAADEEELNMANPASQRDKCFTNHFSCDLSDQIVHISKIRAYFPPVEISDGRNTDHVVYEPGAPGWEDVTFTFMGSSKSLQTVQDWVQKAYDGEDCRKTISINIRNQAQEDVRTYNLIDCLPLHYTKVNLGASGSGQATVVKLKLKCKVNRIECA
jgi:phage tail-like protein